MMFAIFSVKGGSGTSVVAASISQLLARHTATVLIDLAGDLPTILGRNDGAAPGTHDWLNAGDDVPVDSLRRLEIELAPGFSMMTMGGALDPIGGGRGRILACVLAADPRTMVVDCGLATTLVAQETLRIASHRIVVIRGCYTAIKKLVGTATRPDGIVLIAEPGRALGRKEIEHATGLPVVCEIPFDAAISRTVDAGLLACRTPSQLSKPLERWLVSLTGVAA